jgi:hypothetical protein
LVAEFACTFVGALILRFPDDPTTIAIVAVLLQPAVLVAVTEYVVVVAGETEMVWAVAPFDQRTLAMFVPVALSVRGAPG